MSTKTFSKPFIKENIELEELLEQEHELVVLNDDYNTFDYVIETLIKVCEHTPQQAEQCTILIHYKGKATVKFGDFEKLRPMRDAICERGISAQIL